MARSSHLVLFTSIGLGVLHLAFPARPAAAYALPFTSPVVADAAFADVEALLAADIDGDGKLDLVAAGAGGVAWWRENAGVYTRTTISAGAAVDLAVGDLDADGDLDVGIATAGSLLLAKSSAGGGSWTVGTVQAPLAARSVAMADLDGDGRLDLLAAFATGVDWWRNSAGDGSVFARIVIGALTSGSGAVAGDCDNDGDLDVVSSSDGASDRLRYWSNTLGTGASWTGNDLATGQDGARSPVLADLDGDGWLDAAAALADDGRVRVYRNDHTPGSGAWTASLAAVAVAPRQLSSLDLDLDGDADLVLGGGDAIAWAENLGAGDFAGHGIAASVEGRAAAGDFDRDGDLDLMYGGAADDTLFFLPNQNAARTFVARARQDVETIDGARAVVAGDLDNDGDADLAVAAFASAQVRWEENTPAGWVAHPLPGGLTGAFGLTLGDLDGDGDLDVIAAGETASAVVWWRNDWPLANTFTRLSVGTLPGARGVAAGDVDRDGDLDVVAAGVGDDMALFTNNGGSFTRTFITTTFNRAQSVALADVDGDGDADIVAAGNTADEVAWWQNTSSGTVWTKRAISGATLDGAYSVHAVDLDLDGDLDVVSTSESEDSVTFWDNTAGDGSAWSERLVGFLNQAESAGVADFDGDGDLDIVGAGWKDGGRVAYFRNNGGAASWTKSEITITFDGAGSVAVADLNRDGLPDFAATAETADKVAVWQNGGGQAALVPTAISGGTLPAGSETALFRLALAPRGRPADNNAELAAVTLVLEEAPGDPLSPAEADALLEQIEILRDNPSGGVAGSLDGTDISLATLASFAPDAGGALAVAIPDDLAMAAVAQGSTGTFFVTVTTAASYGSLAIGDLRVTLAPQRSRVEDRLYDTGLRLEWAASAATAFFPVNDFANLALDVEGSADPVVAGSNLTYTLTLTNAGPDASTGAAITSTLPSGASLVSSSGCSQDPNGAPTCTVGALAAGATLQVQLVVAVPGAASAPLSFGAQVAGSLFDPSLADNGASETTAVTASADLAIAVSSPHADYAAGSPLPFTVAAQNHGPGPALAATVSVDLPAALASVFWTCTASPGASCGAPSGSGDIAGQTVNLPAGGLLTYRYRSQVPAGATAALTATAAIAAGANTVDSVSGNNTGGVTVGAGSKIFYDGFEVGLAAWSLVIP